MAFVDNFVCPLHAQGIPFMWYIKKKNGDMIYEYDDRVIPHWTDCITEKYSDWLDQAQQEYYRRNISFTKNMGRIGLELLDSIIRSISNNNNGAIRETLFSKLPENDMNVQELGLIGNRGRIYFDTQDGIIRIPNDKDLNVHFEYGGIRYNITGNTDDPNIYYNLIERHYGSYEFDLMKKGTQTVKGNITAWAIGHKGVIPSGLFHMYYELMFVLPIGSPYYIELVLQPDEDMEVDLHLTYLANDVKNTVRLEKDKASRFHILI